jgi:hypothetical protein
LLKTSVICFRDRRGSLDDAAGFKPELAALRLRHFFGIGFGSRAVIFSALTADIFSGKGFGSILDYSTVAVGVGGALGSWLGERSMIGPAAIWCLLRSRLCFWLAPMRASG